MLPKALRRFTPDAVRDSPRVRSLALGTGLIPPRPMHSDGEGGLLRDLATSAGTVVEIGVFEGSSAVALVEALPPGATLHLIDPFGHHPDALRPGWRAVEWASRRAVARAAKRAPRVRVAWHVERSEDTAHDWSDPVDVVFIDGDHSEQGCRLDWELWHGHVAPGGRVMFHDARAGREGGRGLPGPTAVVDGLFRGDGAIAGWRIEREVDSAVVVRRDA